MDKHELPQNQRATQVLDYMVDYLNIAASRKELAKVLGYSESMLSLITNEKKPVSEKFLDSVIRVVPTINREWILTGNGNMVNEKAQTSIFGENPAIKRQQELIKQAYDLLETMLARGYGEDIISRQMEAIASLQNTLESIESKSATRGHVIVNSTVESFRDNTNSLNGAHIGNVKRRGRKTNASKLRNNPPEQHPDNPEPEK